ncbi:hypothetical protein DPEC_G00231280 [Dallia pectoralis]|uniref:Uncharacterized protein n=1 Tax=Dallia pectoralis TaxID=75939 RepID=A0ACC2FX07_DALPE|nr:hypothetical protein DPEC_G00231280 [Dallia pectoralis]
MAVGCCQLLVPISHWGLSYYYIPLSTITQTSPRNMNRSQISFLLYCGVLLTTTALARVNNSTESTSLTPNVTTITNTDLIDQTTNDETYNYTDTNTPARTTIQVKAPTTAVSQNTLGPSKATSSPTTDKPATPRALCQCLLEKKDRVVALVVLGVVAVVFTVLLVTTLALICHVYQLNHQYRGVISSRPTKSNIDLVSGAVYLRSTKRTKEMPGSEPEITESSLLMSELKQTQKVHERGTEDTKDDNKPPNEGAAATEKSSSGSANNGGTKPVKSSSLSKETAESTVTTAAPPTSTTATPPTTTTAAPPTTTTAAPPTTTTAAPPTTTTADPPTTTTAALPTSKTSSDTVVVVG